MFITRLRMRKAFLFNGTNKPVCANSDREVGINTIVTNRTVVVKTPERVGAGAVLAGCVVTSLFLVRNQKSVHIRFRNGEMLFAEITACDEENNLAKLLPRSLDGSPVSIRETDNLRIGEACAVGDKLIVTNTKEGWLALEFAMMSYVTKVCERRADSWNVRARNASGRVGSGVWSPRAEFVGLSLEERDAPLDAPILEHFERLRVAHEAVGCPLMYAVPAETVMDFAERK